MNKRWLQQHGKQSKQKVSLQWQQMINHTMISLITSLFEAMSLFQAPQFSPLSLSLDAWGDAVGDKQCKTAWQQEQSSSTLLGRAVSLSCFCIASTACTLFHCTDRMCLLLMHKEWSWIGFFPWVLDSLFAVLSIPCLDVLFPSAVPYHAPFH